MNVSSKEHFTPVGVGLFLFTFRVLQNLLGGIG
jgi:hypothetical protein